MKLAPTDIHTVIHIKNQDIPLNSEYHIFFGFSLHDQLTLAATLSISKQRNGTYVEYGIIVIRYKIPKLARKAL